MKRKTKIIIFLSVIIIILVPIHLLSEVNKKIEGKNENSNQTTNETQNMQANQNTNNTTNELLNEMEETNEVNNTVNNTEEENNIANTNTSTDTNTIPNQPSEEVNVSDPEQKAIAIAQNNWGEDDSVYASFDGIESSTGYYIIGIRDKETTYIKCWYYVNVQDGTFTVKR